VRAPSFPAFRRPAVARGAALFAVAALQAVSSFSAPAAAGGGFQDRQFDTDGDGYIRNWLSLPPIGLGPAVASHSEAAEKPFFNREFFKGQKAAMPFEGWKVVVGGKTLEWKIVAPGGPIWDMGQVENAIVFGVAYVVATQNMRDVFLLIGSDDSSCWTLNGAEVIRIHGGRGVKPDENRSGPLTLKQGLNVLTVAVINGSGSCGACARFVDRSGKPVRGLKILTVPRRAPEIVDGGVCDVTADKATIQAELRTVGAAQAWVFVYYGRRDGGTNKNAWAMSGRLKDPKDAGVYRVRILHGSTNAMLRYRVCATNAFGVAWAESSGSFMPGLVEVRASRRESTEARPASFVISRPLTATNAPLAVNLQISGGVNGLDFDLIDNPVTIPAGAAEINQPLIPSSGWRGDMRPKFITLEILPGGYIVGESKSAAILARPR